MNGHEFVRRLDPRTRVRLWLISRTPVRVRRAIHVMRGRPIACGLTSDAGTLLLASYTLVDDCRFLNVESMAILIPKDVTDCTVTNVEMRGR